jgi:hypothetical protein
MLSAVDAGYHRLVPGEIPWHAGDEVEPGLEVGEESHHSRAAIPLIEDRRRERGSKLMVQ